MAVYDQIQDNAELVSLALTVPVIVGAVLVIIHWQHAARYAAGRRADDRTPNEWLILGITAGFLGSALDNAYWAVPWSLSYLGHNDTGDFVNFGVFPNIPFRQVAGIIAAYCHVRSAVSRQDGSIARLHNLLLASLWAGFAYAVLLHLLRP